MFKKGDDIGAVLGGPRGAQDSTESIIGPSVHLEGNFNSSGNIVIAGSLSGSLTTVGKVRVEDGAKVQATVSAAHIFVAGEVRGDIYASEQLELAPSARVIGNIDVKVLSVLPGAIIHGKCSMKNGGSKKPEEVSKKVKTARGAKIEETVMNELEV